jgi:hypothetical protein
MVTGGRHPKFNGTRDNLLELPHDRHKDLDSSLPKIFSKFPKIFPKFVSVTGFQILKDGAQDPRGS